MRLPSSCVTERTIRERSSGSAGGADADDLGQVFLRLFGRARVEHQRAADLHLVAAGQLVLADALAVDERAVGAVQVGDRVVALDAADFGVVAGDFGVVKLDACWTRRARAGWSARSARSGCPDRLRG